MSRVNPGIKRLVEELESIGVIIDVSEDNIVLFPNNSEFCNPVHFEVKNNTYLYGFLENMLNMIKVNSAD